MIQHNIILLDVGGTFVKSSLGSVCKGAIEGTFASTPISSNGTAEEIIASFRTAVSEQLKKATENGMCIDAICAALPGPFDYKKGVFLMKHKFAAVYGMSFREILGEVISENVRLAFVHDVNGALLGALTANPSLKEGNVAMVTLGTGLGFAYAVNGVVQESETGSPAKGLWNMPYMNGTLEELVSRRGIIRLYTENGGILAEGEDVKEIAMRAMSGETEALAAFEQAGAHLATGAAQLIEELGIRQIVFGGQISRSFHLMEKAIRERLPKGVEVCASPDIEGLALIGASSL